jgi:hypothetical protein
MVESISSKRLTLRAVLRDVNPTVIRIVEISDQLRLADFHDIFRSMLGWDGDLGYIIRIHGQEFNSFRRNTRSKAVHEFQLHRQEKFLYICDTFPGCWRSAAGATRLPKLRACSSIRTANSYRSWKVTKLLWNRSMNVSEVMPGTKTGRFY